MKEGSGRISLPFVAIFYKRVHLCNVNIDDDENATHKHTHTRIYWRRLVGLTIVFSSSNSFKSRVCDTCPSWDKVALPAGFH
ncbi:hypothetical protein T03_1873 [Trichinella britovi]|uniref:Uncharacterized protein n=1 Tax=Trichinella britovi TaxID=45882 RepID=A0A0V1D053_TRIBR|nr:hypothetical protein T03_1873 [Trichinella britovi]